MYHNRLLLLVLIFFFFYPVCFFGQQPRGSQSSIIEEAGVADIYGIVIGVSDYDHQPRLAYADKDAEAMYRYLLSLQGTKGASDKIALFTNRQATRDAIAEKLYDINDHVKKGDKVYVYFGGHGDMEHLDQTKNCLLLLSNSPRKNYLRVSNSYLDIDLFSKFFTYWSEKQVKVFFVCDACHSGSLSGGNTGRNNTLFSLQQAWKNEVKMLSCQPDELSLERFQWGGGRGLFSFYLITGMQGLADRNKDSSVTLFELKRFLEDSVSFYSEQSQTPALSGGNINSVMTRYTTPMYIAARQSLQKGLSTTFSTQRNDLAFKGDEDEVILQSLKDSVKHSLFRSFIQHMQNGKIISPTEDCALSVFHHFGTEPEFKSVKGYMKLKLMNVLQQGFEEMIGYLYNDKFEQFDFGKRYEIGRNISACIELAGRNHYLYNKIRARRLFLSATDVSWGIQTGAPATGKMLDHLQNGIDSLKTAISLDPMAPYLYLRLGDYYLFTSSYSEAISAYETYVKLLPKDEYALNKLGFAFFQTGNLNKAEILFQQAVSINPSFHKARENWEAIKKKLQ